MNKTENCIGKLYYGENCTQKCSDNDCKTCNRQGFCLTCYNNTLFGNYCNQTCDNCPNGQGCDINGKCLNETENCKEELFFGENCDQKCSDNNCKTCNRKGICLTCNTNTSFGEKCDKTCDLCPGEKGCNIIGKCLNETENCKGERYFGEKCDEKCSEKNCETCNRKGICLSCQKNTLYGETCNETCENCPESGCNITGFCVDTIHDCKNKSFYGEKCDKKCTEVFTDKCMECSRETGKCSLCYNEIYFGDNCEKPCGHCKNKMCNITNGECYDQICDHNYYNLPYCNESCPLNCAANTCNDNTGICVGCEDETYYGDKCDKHIKDNQTLENCTIVDQKGECKKCKSDQLYWTYCDRKCEGCDDGCNMKGICKNFNCTTGYYGHKCNDTCVCGTNKITSYCGKYSGRCLDCNFGYYDKNCNKTCHYKCRTELCCLIKDKLVRDSNDVLILETNYKYLNVYIEGKDYIVEIDYNNGFPLSLFNKDIDVQGKNFTSINYDFTNYKLKGYLYKDFHVTFNNTVENNYKDNSFDIDV